MAEEEVYTEPITGEMVETTGVLGHIERATIDIQIATAHQYPRSITLFKNRALEMVTLDEETAQSCIYRRPVGKNPNGTPKYAEGKSIRMAEIVASCYGNIRVGAMLIEQTDRFVKARGMAHDLESNFAASTEVIESTVTSNGTPYSERMRIVVAKACLAKARRDATFQVVPGALCKTLEEAARLTAIGTEKTIGERRSKVMDWINKAGVKAEQVFIALGIKGEADIGLKELEVLTGLKTAIKDGDITIEEAFPLEPVKMPTPKQEIKSKASEPSPKPKTTQKTTRDIPSEKIEAPGASEAFGDTEEVEAAAKENATDDYLPEIDPDDVPYGVDVAEKDVLNGTALGNEEAVAFANDTLLADAFGDVKGQRKAKYIREQYNMVSKETWAANGINNIGQFCKAHGAGALTSHDVTVEQYDTMLAEINKLK